MIHLGWKVLFWLWISTILENISWFCSRTYEQFLWFILHICSILITHTCIHTHKCVCMSQRCLLKIFSHDIKCFFWNNEFLSPFILCWWYLQESCPFRSGFLIILEMINVLKGNPVLYSSISAQCYSPPPHLSIIFVCANYLPFLIYLTDHVCVCVCMRVCICVCCLPI